MDSDNKTAIIEIVSIEPSDYGVKIMAQDKRVFNVPKTKKNSKQATVAWKQLTNMELKGQDPITGAPGDHVEVWYREVSNQHGGISRYISTFKEAAGRELTQDTPQAKTTPPSNSSASGGQPDEYWDKKAYKQCLWGYWLERFNKQGANTPMSEMEMAAVWNTFKDIEADADKRFAKRWAKGESLFKESELPVIQQEEPPPIPLEAYGDDIEY